MIFTSEIIKVIKMKAFKKIEQSILVNLLEIYVTRFTVLYLVTD